jgi:hypothetical protein
MTYLDDPNYCPVCGSTEINAHRGSFDHTEARQAVTCSGCAAEWHDLFTLTGYELVVETVGEGHEMVLVEAPKGQTLEEWQEEMAELRQRAREAINEHEA